MAGSVTVMLTDDEERRLDDEPEVTVLEGAAVALAHQEADQPCVALAHLFGGLVERDACTVDDGEVRGERSVQRDEAVIEDRDDVLR